MDPFVLKLILSFIIGGLYIAFTIWISEKYGSKIGGLLIGLPSTLLISLIFIYWTQNQSAAIAAIPIVPAAIAANSLFLVTFVALYKRGRSIAFLGAIALWFILTLPLAFNHIRSLTLSLIISAVFFMIAVLYLNKFPSRKLEKFIVSKKEFLLRSVFAGLIVIIAVYLGKALGPLWGGLFASFPAAFFSSIYLLEKKHGIDFTASVAKTMPYGSMGNVIFATAFYFLVPVYGMIMGLIVSYLLALFFAIITYKLVINKQAF